MARIEADREDLYEEFRSARMKWEVKIAGCDSSIIFGIRHDNRLSIYFSQDQCYHFDQYNRLLRAYVDGVLFRTQGDTLASMIRVRTDTETILQRRDLSAIALSEFLSEATQSIHQMYIALKESDFTVLRTNVKNQMIQQATERIAAFLQGPLQLAPPFPTRKS